ncbi:MULTISPECIES: RagB/SusD family nutrient uptake outer membrane protein [unclassified Leeuwenhoekiella]|uniref:RagB/SusD family nutrient uptake outer membrane protein n=1 Tax=unclassified Leeuwenhoekiella TaxID=2615029 RepID=UPI000C58F109|nr:MULTISPECIES: RagB/SusD family nutrient uptake outer membrane protein [unclassified Leeuwenhoekiella]MAW94470.1 RagB/SusD family nutrient uptake outer membrane protein [Leeuwenhoekiella sp.]MAW96966.1 RagB/SusD family nutrient uptake outer membrane protein [Leeuwenhoekiella sp.]MBA81148.1 RagB/SusD family nutrient uptake outer membrane protein [Leeuwenhoekiella sp.]|tara:strand:+ start:24338 stop:25936 length:1599 start_codon:yes stop_codon:yes gene_type:complete
MKLRDKNTLRALRKLAPLAIVLTFFATSCTNLDEEVFSEITEDSFIPADEDIVALTASAYTPLRYIMSWQGLFDLQEESADTFVTPTRPNGWDDGGTYKRMHFHTWDETQYQPRNTWLSCFRGVNNINRVISQIESGSLPITEDQALAVTSELRALRGLYYSILLDTHGNVPILKDFSDEVPQQSSRQEVYDFVVSELTEVIPNLSETVDVSTYGRLTKYGAMQILARVYLNAEVYTGTAQWEKSLALCNEIIDSNKYQLDSDYGAIFTTENQSSPEIVFSVPYDRIYAGEWNQHMKMLLPSHRDVLNMQAQPWGGSSANPQIIDSYEPGDKRLEETWFEGEQRDADTGELLFTLVNFMPSIYFCEFEEGLRCHKYDIAAGSNGSLSNDFPMLRYTDVLMMKAEILLRTNKADDAAVIVSEVRSRSFENSADASVTGAELMADSTVEYGVLGEDGEVADAGNTATIPYGRFLDELAWEFAAEARRRTDLIRFGVYQTKSWYNHTPQGDYTTLFPIGLEELNTNPNLSQNPGY